MSSTTKKVMDEQIFEAFDGEKSNNWIHTQMKVGMNRIKKLRKLYCEKGSTDPEIDDWGTPDLDEDSQPTYLPKVGIPQEVRETLMRLSYNRHVCGKDRLLIRSWLNHETTH